MKTSWIRDQVGVLTNIRYIHPKLRNCNRNQDALRRARVRQRREAPREQVCLQSKIERMRQYLSTWQLWISRGSDIMAIDGNSIATKGKEPVEGFSAEAIVHAYQIEQALSAPIRATGQSLDSGQPLRKRHGMALRTSRT